MRTKDFEGITDDVQVYGNDSIHDLHLHETVERTRKVGFKLNFDGCIIQSKSCSFLGNIYTTKELKSDPKKIKAFK